MAVMVQIVDLLAPLVVGLKVTFTQQFPPASIVGVSVVHWPAVVPAATANWPLSPPVTAMAETLSGPTPVFEMVTWVAAEVWPARTELKSMGPTGVTEMLGFTPVPFRVTLAVGKSKSLEAMFSVAVLAPTAVGLKVTFTQQFPPAVIVGVSVVHCPEPPPAATAKSPVLAPPMAMAEPMTRFVVPVLEMVTWVAADV